MTKQANILPKGWAEARMMDVAKLIFGQSPPSSTYNKEGIGLPFFQGKSEYGAVYPTARVWCTEPTRTAEKDDVLISVRAPVGPTNLAPSKCAIGRGLAAIRTNIELGYLRYYLKLIENELASKGTGTTFSAITKDILQNQRVVIAPLNEQRQIVDKIERLFSDLDKGEENLRTAQRLLSSYRQSVLKAAVTGELTRDWREANKTQLESGEKLLQRILTARREQWQGRGKYAEPIAPDTNNLPPLPDGWVWISPDQISIVFGNGLSKKPAAYETKYPILRISAVRPMAVDTSDIRFYEPDANEKLDNFWVKNGDLLFTRYNGSSHLVGVCGLHRGADVLHPDKIIKSRTVEIDGLSRDYLELCLNVGESRTFIRRNIKTTAGQQGIAGGDLKLTPIPLAPAEEQLKIADRVRDALSRISVLEAWCETELKRSATLRQSILKSAFSGQLVPQDAADETASELLKRIQADRATAAKQKPATKRGRSSKKEAA